MKLNIAIDGPSGAGKSTVAKRLAKELNCIYVDTGAMYRATAKFFLENKIALDDEKKIEENLEAVDIKLEMTNGRQIIKLNNVDVTDDIRTQEIGEGASKLAVIGVVRSFLVAQQKEIGRTNDVVMDGRDIGSTVLVNAPYKFYLDASSSVRASRRIGELKKLGIEADFETVKREIEDRDRRDKERKISPLIQTEDAIYVDTSEKNIDVVVATLLKIITKN